MAGTQKLTTAVTPELSALLAEAVEEGGYASTSEVVREALTDWQQKREHKREAVLELRRLWDEGLASGEPGPLDVDAIKHEGRRRLSHER